MITVARGLYFVVGVVNLLPVSGVLSAVRLEALYGVTFIDPNVVILMRHRAVLFAVVGALLMTAAFVSRLRPIAVGAGLLSMLSFVLIAYAVGDFNAELRRVVVVDVAASLLLVLAAVLSSGPASPRRRARRKNFSRQDAKTPRKTVQTEGK